MYLKACANNIFHFYSYTFSIMYRCNTFHALLPTHDVLILKISVFHRRCDENYLFAVTYHLSKKQPVLKTILDEKIASYNPK